MLPTSINYGTNNENRLLTTRTSKKNKTGTGTAKKRKKERKERKQKQKTKKRRKKPYFSTMKSVSPGDSLSE